MMAQKVPSGPQPQPRGRRVRNRLHGESRWMGYAYIAPWLVGFLGLLAGPMLYMLYVSFTNYNFSPGAEWVGLANYRALVTPGSGFGEALGVTFLYASLSVPIKLAVALAVATLLNRHMRGIGLYRTAYYLPSLVGGSVAIAIMWDGIFGSNGLLDTLLTGLHLPTGDWIANPSTALLTLVLLSVWQFGTPMLIFLAGLRQIPSMLYEVAVIDGATRWRRFLHITLPLLSPVVFFNLVIEIIGSFKVFTQPYIITQGGPLDRTMVILLYIYDQAFSVFRMGYAASASVVLLAIVGGLAALGFLGARYWVYYESGER